MTKKEINDRLKIATGRLSAPSKMPCSSYSIPAKRCLIGAKLAQVKDSTCSGCYALKGFYTFPSTQKALEHRYSTLKSPTWAADMVLNIETNNKGDRNCFRWHDSGDLQSVEHYRNIAKIAEALPSVNFWLPTREYKFAKDSDAMPRNLVTRFSAHMNDSVKEIKNKRHASIVITSLDKVKPLQIEAGRKIKVCPATLPDSNHKCNDCRACWHTEDIIAYLKH